MRNHSFDGPGQRCWRDEQARRAEIRRRARARRGALVRHSRRSGSTDMQAGLRRCGPLVRHSKTISGWTTKVQVPGPCRSRVGQVGADGIRRRARAGRGALVRHSRTTAGWEITASMVRARGAGGTNKPGAQRHVGGPALDAGRSCVTLGAVGRRIRRRARGDAGRSCVTPRLQAGG